MQGQVQGAYGVLIDLLHQGLRSYSTYKSSSAWSSALCLLVTLTTLTNLSLYAITLADREDVPGTGPADDLLAAWQQLTQLRHLGLRRSLRQFAEPANPGLYSALLASSQLVSLDVSSNC